MISLAPISRAPYRSATTHQRVCALRYTAAMNAAADHALQRDAVCAGWSGELSLGYERRGGRTVLARRLHRGPLVVQKSLYPEGEALCQNIVVHPPAGIVGGDRPPPPPPPPSLPPGPPPPPGAAKRGSPARAPARPRAALARASPGP